MADQEQLAMLRQGVQLWNAWRVQDKRLMVDLSGADLSRADLSGADLSGADLSRANLNGANLNGAILTGADLTRTRLSNADLISTNLTGANLDGAGLRRAYLYGAYLIGANLSRAYLNGTSLSGADLSHANLKGARLCETIFADTNLTRTKGLGSCEHEGPSTLDHRTLTQSGPLPLDFLRGCGLPESLITYLPSLLNQAIQFYSCFISYSTHDQPFADRLHADLQKAGVRCWFAPHDMAAGKKIHEQIDEAIRVYDRLLLILSEHSMKSRWVKSEIANARKKELAQNRQVLFPIRLIDMEAIRPWKLFDPDSGDDSAAELREYFIPDFTNWDKDRAAYNRTFDKLVRDLQAKESSAPKA